MKILHTPPITRTCLSSVDVTWCPFSKVKERMQASTPSGRETVDAYKARLRRTALSTPTADVKKMIANVKKRAGDIDDADGGDIQRD